VLSPERFSKPCWEIEQGERGNSDELTSRCDSTMGKNLRVTAIPKWKSSRMQRTVVLSLDKLERSDLRVRGDLSPLARSLARNT
jgi:hypothetical protein